MSCVPVHVSVHVSVYFVVVQVHVIPVCLGCIYWAVIVQAVVWLFVPISVIHITQFAIIGGTGHVLIDLVHNKSIFSLSPLPFSFFRY